MTFLELEKKCKKRRVFRLIKILSAFVVFACLGYFAYYFYTVYSKKNIKHDIPKKTVNEHNKTIPVQKTIKKINIKKEVKKIEKFTYELDLNVTGTKENKIQVKTAVKKDKKAKKDKNLSAKPKKTDLNLQTQTLPSYNTCIALAENYLKKGDYSDALQWAKNANMQNKDDAKSWLISAKALHGMNKKEEALKLLKIYYNYHKDERVKKLIGEYENEK